MQEEKAEQKQNSENPEESSQAPEENTDKLIRHHIYAAMGIGLIPVPFADFAGVAAVQLNLVRKLAQFYHVPFSKDMVKPLIAALIGGAAPASFGRYLFSMIKTVPVAGHIVGGAGMVIVGGASTYAVGKVFNRHFAEGGTFLSFEPEEAKAFYAEMFKEGKKVAADLKSENKAKAAMNQ